MDFLWHSVSEEEKKDIKKEAKRIMDSFSKKLSELDKISEEPFVERDSGMRSEGSGEECDETFKDMLFKNFRIKDSDSARESKNDKDSGHEPNKNNDFIIGEKKKW